MRQKAASPLHSKNMERKCADTIGTVPRFPGLSISNDKILMYFSQIKYTEAIISNNTRKVLWLEITKMLTAVKEKILRHLLYFFSTLSFPIGPCLYTLDGTLIGSVVLYGARGCEGVRSAVSSPSGV